MSTVRYHLFVPKITASNTGAVKNDGGVPAILSGLDNSKPAPGVIGRIYIATDTKWIYRDNGTVWELLGTNAVTVNDVPVRRIEASTPDQITDQITITPAEEVRDRLYNPIPLVQRGSLTDLNITSVSDIAIRGNYMYLFGGDKIVAVNIANHLSPSIVGSLAYGGLSDYKRLDIQGNYLYATSHAYGTIACIDISDPSLPSLVWNYSVATGTNYVNDVIVLGNYLYVTYRAPGDLNDYLYLKIYDISGALQVISTTQVSYYHSAYEPYILLAIKGNYLYISVWDGAGSRIKVYDITNRSSLVYKSTIDAMFMPRFMKIQGNYLYVAGHYQMSIYDITNPVNPIFKSDLSISKTFYGLDISGNYAYLTSRGTSDGSIHIADISNPVLPEIKKSFTSPDLLNASVVGVQGNYIYAVADGTNKIIVFG